MTRVNKKTTRIRLIYQDTTPAAFLAGLHKHCPSAGLFEDEAGRCFQSRLVDELALLNKAWNGSTVIVDRKHERFKIRSPRCTISWMVQPGVFQKFMLRKGDEARGIGFLARCLVSYPLSTQGWRLLGNRPQSMGAIERFRAQVSKLLHDQMDYLRPGPMEDDDE